MAKRAAANSPKVTVGDVVDAVDRVAPFNLAEGWDNVGLQVGSRDDRATRVLVTLEASADVLAEAVAKRADIILSHHPLIFRERRTFAEVDPVSRLAAAMIRRRIAFISAHTNVDSIAEGTNGVLADALGLGPHRTFLRPAFPPGDALVKFVVFVPLAHVDAVTAAIGRAGGGMIGNYSHCTFRTPGTGTFLPLAGARPHIGTVGALESVDELRIECVCPRGAIARLVAEVRAAHPYEEMAFDVLPTETPLPASRGLGLIGTLDKPAPLAAIARRLRRSLGLSYPTMVGDPDATISTISLCTGAGGEFLRTGRIGGADLFVTGELSHHDAWEARERGMNVLLIGHFPSETIVCHRLADLVRDQLSTRSLDVEFLVSAAQRDPILPAL